MLSVPAIETVFSTSGIGGESTSGIGGDSTSGTSGTRLLNLGDRGDGGDEASDDAIAIEPVRATSSSSPFGSPQSEGNKYTHAGSVTYAFATHSPAKGVVDKAQSKGDLIVTACGDKSKCVGTFTEAGTHNGKPWYRNESEAIFY